MTSDRRRVGIAVKVADPIAVGGDHHSLVLAELDGVAGVLDERRDIGADEPLAIAHAEHQRGRPPGGDDRAGFVGIKEYQREVSSNRRSTASTEAAKSPAVSPWAYRRATRCTATSVSVSLANSTPACSSSWRRGRESSRRSRCGRRRTCRPRRDAGERCRSASRGLRHGDLLR